MVIAKRYMRMGKDGRKGRIEFYSGKGRKTCLISIGMKQY
jgi:hypothetical protein